MKELNKIPSGKINRAAKFINTGVKIGGNYLKHYGKKVVLGGGSTEELHSNNSETIYNALSELKGSALKVAQMLSMDKTILPAPYQEKFIQSQYSTPPISFPLVKKTIVNELKADPDALFDSFSTSAVRAASIGQVHKAEYNGTPLAVKVQYPGVAQSISADLKMVKPIALKMFKLNEADLNEYMVEVEEKLLEETDYKKELENAVYLTEKLSSLPGIRFPKYFKKLSAEKVLSMEWLEGVHLDEFLKTNPSQESRDKYGQLLWDFVNYQIHELKFVHADPHPGNFLFQSDGNLGVIDFGCVKQIPEDFYTPYFKLLQSEFTENDEELMELFTQLEFVYKEDSPQELDVFFSSFKRLLALLGRPIFQKEFDFGNDSYFSELYELGEELSKNPVFRNSTKSRGSRHGLYVNRTYFGLYNILNQLGARVKTKVAY